MLRRRFWLSIAVCAAIFVVVSLGAPLIGSAHIDYTRALNGQSPDREILFYARIPRILLAILAGGALTLTGVLFQALLRDPLAEPFTLGISSGSSLGAVIAISLGLTTVAGIPAVLFTAFAGAAATLAIVLGIAFEPSGNAISFLSMRRSKNCGFAVAAKVAASGAPSGFTIGSGLPATESDSRIPTMFPV